MQRDTTVALNYVTLALETTDAEKRTEYLTAAQQILRDEDARETKRDPRLRKATKKRAHPRKKVPRRT